MLQHPYPYSVSSAPLFLSIPRGSASHCPWPSEVDEARSSIALGLGLPSGVKGFALAAWAPILAVDHHLLGSILLNHPVEMTQYSQQQPWVEFLDGFLAQGPR